MWRSAESRHAAVSSAEATNRGYVAQVPTPRHRLAALMGPFFDGYPVWMWAIGLAFLGAGAIQWIYSIARSGRRRKRDQAIAAVCTQHGLGRVEDVGSPLLSRMVPVSEPVCHNTFATPDWAQWFSEVGDRSGSSVFAVLVFGVDAVNLPNIEVARKGQIDVPLGGHGQTVQLESIDFTDRFQIHTDDPHAAVMLIDQGMMQWLLDCDRVSFQINGPLVTAMLKLRDPHAAQPDELELLFQFHDGFVAHVPNLIRVEFPAPAGYAEAVTQAMHTVTPEMLLGALEGAPGTYATTVRPRSPAIVFRRR